MKKRLWIGITAAAVAVILVLLFFGGFFLPKEARAYNKAVAQLKKQDSVTFDITQTTTTKVDGTVTELKVDQVLTYAELQSKTPIIQLEETFSGSSSSEKYTEYRNKNTLYVEAGTSAAFQGDLSKKEAKYRYVPIKMLNILGYKKVSVETGKEKFPVDMAGHVTYMGIGDEIKTVHFKSPKSAFGERWALPIGAKFVTASGSAQLDKNGKLLRSQYSITYTRGSAEITVDTVSKPREKAREISLPTDTDRFVELSFVDAPRMVAYTSARLKSLSSATISGTEYLLKEHNGQLLTTGNTLKARDIALYDTDDGLQYAVVSATSNNNGVSQLSTLYQDGIYFKSDAGNGEPARYKLDETIARYRLIEDLTLPVPAPKYWKDVTLTDLNGVYFLEFTYNAQYEKEFQTSACGNRSNHTLKELSGYLALDKGTLTVTACGTHSECDHSDNGGTQTTIRLQNTLVEAPSLGAYEVLFEKLPEEKEPENKATPLLYRVTGKDGQEMWLLGTIHIGDNRTAYLPKELTNALKASDALALEVDMEKFEEQAATSADIAQRITNAYTYADSQTQDHLDDEVYDLALKYIKASGNYTYGIDSMKVALWENTIGNFYLQLGHRLHSEKGVETRLTQLAKDQKKPIYEVESGIEQLEMLMGWSDDLQEMMLTSTLETNLSIYMQQTTGLYELWCAGDEAALREEINAETNMSLVPKDQQKKLQSLLDEYNKAMHTDRNKKMVDKAVSYLESDETVFFAVGLAHLLYEDSGLVDSLREKGYTVELVQYDK